MAQFKNGRVNDMETRPSIIPIENPSNLLHAEAHIEPEEESDQPAEARAWSGHERTNSENILGEGPTRQQKVLLSSSVEGQRVQSKDDPRRVERILSYADRGRPRQKQYRLTWRTFIGTMAEMEQIYARADFLRCYKYFQPIFIFMDSVFRGIGQVMFANNPLSGIMITIALLIGNWEITLYGLLGTIVSTLTAHLLGFSYHSIRSGLYGYNGCLTGMGISFFSFSCSPQTIGPVVIMSAFSTVFAMSISNILVQRLELSPFTFSFQISTWIWLLGALKFRYFFLNGTILSPELLSTLTDKPVLLNVSFPGYSAKDNFVGFFSTISQVYFVENPYSGAIILLGICICSRILSFFALFGAVTGQLTAAYLFGLPRATIHAGLWGYNSVLSSEALGGMFFVLYGYRIWFLTLCGSIMTVLLQAATSAFLSPVGMPVLTFPFTFVCWVFCLIAGSTNLIAVKLVAISIPEDHRRRYRLSQLVKGQFQFINHLTHLSSSIDEDITWEDLSRIKEIFVPAFICSYVYQDDINSLKMLIRQNVNIHSVDGNFRSPLHISASQGNLKITKWLVKDIKINVNLVDKFGGTPLLDALFNGRLHLLSFLYSHGARFPASKSKELAFYLNAFVYEGNLEAIQCLLSCGFNPNSSDYDGRNALHLAAITNRFDIVRYLVEEFSVCLDIVDYFHQTATDYALRLTDSMVANYLIENRDKDSIPQKTSKEKSQLLEVIIEKHLENKQDFEQKKSEQDAKHSMVTDKTLLSTLFYIFRAQEDLGVVIKFLEEYPQLNVLYDVDYDFRSAAHVAAAEGRIEIIRFLFEQCQSCDFERIMNREDRWNLSPLDEAYHHRHLDICNFVTEKRTGQTNQVDQKTFHCDDKQTEEHPTIFLLRKWKKVHTFATLAALGAAERIDGLFYRGYFLPTELYEDYHGRNPMHFAAANGHLNVIQVLIKYRHEGAIYTDRWGNYPIDEARQKKHQKIIDELTQLNL